MRKKLTGTVILLLCFLCCAAGCHKLHDWTYYDISFVNNMPDTEVLSPDRYLWLYSVEGQTFSKYGNGEQPRSWGVGDKYIFFTTFNEGARGEFEENAYTLWRCSRETNECESLGKISQASPLVIYDDFLFGVERRGRDIWMMPVEGALDERVSLLEQCTEDETNGITSWNGWNIFLYSDAVCGVTDQKDDTMVISRTCEGYHWDPDEEHHWFCKEGEWIQFPGSRYQRWGEKEGHDICPEYFDGILFQLGIERAKILPWRIVTEGDKLYVAVMVTTRTQWDDISQEELKRELLVEIDLETDMSRILYDTRNNRTRILGYREGNLYLLEDHIVYRKVLETEELVQMYDLKEDGFNWEMPPDVDYSVNKDIYVRWHGEHMVIWTYNDEDTENPVTIKSLDMTRAFEESKKKCLKEGELVCLS